MGKWTRVVKGLPRLEEELSRQEKLNELKRRLVTEKPEVVASSATLTRHWLALREQKDGLNAKAAEVQLDLDAVGQLLVDACESEGVSAVSLAEGGGVTTVPAPYAVVTDHGAFRAWCLANGYGDQLRLAWQTTNEILKIRLEAGEPPPDGVTAFGDTTLRRK